MRMAEDPNFGDRHLHSSNIDESLDQILRSARFKDSMQLQTLLKYIVEKSLGGHDDALKERIIGIEVFGRKSDYDTADDPIVRSRVGQLRKRLSQYYESDEARGSKVQIVIPNGSYRPMFVFRPEANRSRAVPAGDQPQPPFHSPEGNPEPDAVHLVSKEPRTGRWRVWAVAAAVCCALLLAAWGATTKWRKSELYLLWAPILESKKTVLLYTGTISAYLPSEDYANRTHPPGDEDLPASDPSPAQAQTPTAADLVPFPDGLAPQGDISADLKVAALMNTYNRNFSLRSGVNLPFVDLKGSPAVLIGAYDNHWTINIARDLPFFFDRASRIRERGGARRVWSSTARADNTITEDYAVVFRLLNSKGGGPVLAIAGLTTCGTQAAAEFVTDPVQLRKLSSISRSSLEQKNLEFVLRASLINCTPTSVDIVAQETW
jgi:hypothetical protein